MLSSKGREIKVLFEGKSIEAFEGEPLAVSLHRYGVRIFSRSLKYRKPRGLLCMSGACAQCMLNVDGIPNVRICITPARNGMVVKRQRGWPSTDNDLVSFFLTRREVEAGFQYKAGINFWPLFMWAYTKLTGAGTLEYREIPKKDYKYKSLESDVVIVGGGPAGLGAVVELKETLLKYILLEQMPWFGGDCALMSETSIESKLSSEGHTLQSVASSVASDSTMLNTTVVGFYRPDKILATKRNEELYQIKARSFILATGTYEDLPLIENSDVPCFLSFRGAMILLKGYGLKPGERGVVIGKGERARLVTEELKQAGVSITQVDSDKVMRVKGSKRVSGVVVKNDSGENNTISADFAVAVDGVNPRCELSYQAGAKVLYDKTTENYVTTHDESMRSTENVYAAGAMCSSKSWQESFLQGRVAGLAVAFDLTKEKKYQERLEKLKGELSA